VHVDVMRSPWNLLFSLGVVGLACTQAGVAPGLHRDRAHKLALGMSGEDIVSLLGEPLSDTYDSADGTTRRLVYSRVAVLSLGPSDFILWPGLDVTVVLEENAVVSAHILDTKHSRRCFCEPGSCHPDWVSPCLPSLPP
jgi:hypothetical protein